MYRSANGLLYTNAKQKSALRRLRSLAASVPVKRKSCQGDRALYAGATSHHALDEGKV